MSQEFRTALADAPMHRRQIVIVALCIALMALDGFDVLAISFAAPGIAEEWGISRDVLGIVLSMELFGMAAGSVIIGNVADRIGRRPTIIACLVVMAVGMLVAATTQTVLALAITRLLTGFGIGGMIASTSALVAEYSNDRRRGLNMVLNIAGYSLGAMVGGLVASALLENTGDWRSVFLFGGVVSAIMIVPAIIFLPESILSLIERRPPNALDRVNTTLRTLNHAPLPALPERQVAVKPSMLSLFRHGFAPVTLVLTIAYFSQIMLFYYMQKWIPKILVDHGLDAASAGRVLVSANLGAFLGALAMGLATQRFQLRWLIIGSMLLGFAAIAVFGLGWTDFVALLAIAAVCGFFINAGVVGLYPIFAEVFPASIRAGGTGFVIGMGRGGSAVGPVIAGALFAAGSSLFTVSIAMGAGALVAATMLFILPWARSRVIASA